MLKSAQNIMHEQVVIPGGSPVRVKWNDFPHFTFPWHFNSEYEIVFVNDGSKDETIQRIKQLSNRESNVRFISFSRNFGKEAACGDAVILMDVDLQGPPFAATNDWRLVRG